MAGEDARDLAEFVRTKSPEAFERLARRYASFVHSACRRRLASAADAEDASQAVFLALARKARSVRSERLASWLHGAARRACAFVLRGRARRARHEEEAGRMRKRGSEASGADWDAVRPHLDAEIARLPSKLREAVSRHYLAGQTRARIARELGVPEGTVASRCAAGVERLRSRLAKRGATLGVAALGPALLAQAEAAASAAPASLLASLPGLASGAAASGAGAHAGLIAKGVIRMMFWAKAKLCAAALAAVAVVGTGTGVALTSAHAGETVEAKDFAGRTWKLEDWKEGTRLYEKDLKKREEAYRKKWGEPWCGTVIPWSRSRIMSPGTWEHEDITVIKNGKMALPGTRKTPETLGGHDHRCGIPYPLVYAPGTGETVTDIYVRTQFGFYHVDPETKETVHVGLLPENILRVDPDKCPNKAVHGDPDYFLFPNPKERYPQPLKDGLDSEAHAWIRNTTPLCTLDPIRGRVIFYQGAKWYGGKKMTGYVYRYVEKLLPYTLNGKEVLLPAILDHKEMFKKVGAEPVMKNGKRAPPRFAIRTTKATGAPPVLAGGIYGQRIVLSMDGRSVIVQDKSGLAAVDMETGKRRPIPVKTAEVPKDKNKHGGVCGRWDGYLYNSSGQGSGPAAGVLFRVNLTSGDVDTLYDSLRPPAAKNEKRRENRMWSGPADAISLTFSSTRYQTQCPRTGAILNMGWDGAGIPRYHDGFVTCLAANCWGDHRPEWKGQWVATLGNCNLFLEVAPNGDVYFADKSYHGHGRPARNYPDWGKGRPELVDGIRIVRIFRTDWPAEQPVAGYWNAQISPEDREKLILEYAKKYIANYAELSKIY